MAFSRRNYPQDTWTLRRRNQLPPIMEDERQELGWKPYNFSITYPDVRSLILTIGTLGEDLVGLELGLYRAESFCTVLQCCPNVKKLYGVDSWQTYQDYVGTDGTRPGKVTNPQEMALARGMAYHFLYYSGEDHRGEILEMDARDALLEFEDESLDFIFLDAYLSEQQCQQELRDWYPKVKTGGLFSGHDWDDATIRNCVKKFHKNLTNPRSLVAYDSTWAFIK